MIRPEVFMDKLRSYIGYTESPAGSNCNRFSHALGRPCEKWCADCLAAVAAEVGLWLPSTAAYTPAMAQGFKNAGRWYGPNDPGQVGDFVFWSFGGQRIDHVEAVETPGKLSLLDIGGNTTSDHQGDQTNGGGVYRRKRTRSRKLVGFGRPAWAPVTPPVNLFPGEGDDDMPRIVHAGGAIFAVGHTNEVFTDSAGVTRTGPWRRTFANPSQLEQHIGGGGYQTRSDGNAFDVTIPADVFEKVYGDLGTVQP